MFNFLKFIVFGFSTLLYRANAIDYHSGIFIGAGFESSYYNNYSINSNIRTNISITDTAISANNMAMTVNAIPQITNFNSSNSFNLYARLGFNCKISAIPRIGQLYVAVFGDYSFNQLNVSRQLNGATLETLYTYGYTNFNTKISEANLKNHGGFTFGFGFSPNLWVRCIDFSRVMLFGGAGLQIMEFLINQSYISDVGAMYKETSVNTSKILILPRVSAGIDVAITHRFHVVLSYTGVFAVNNNSWYYIMSMQETFKDSGVTNQFDTTFTTKISNLLPIHKFDVSLNFLW